MPKIAAVICLVAGISDGDTVTLRCGQAPIEKVRLAQIDAPERGQPFGQRAKEHLGEILADRPVALTKSGVDRYGRTIGTLEIGPENINFKMVRDGFAWCYRRYLVDQTCLGIEQEARENRRGLWRDEQPIEPWVWRKR